MFQVVFVKLSHFPEHDNLGTHWNFLSTPPLHHMTLHIPVYLNYLDRYYELMRTWWSRALQLHKTFFCQEVKNSYADNDT